MNLKEKFNSDLCKKIFANSENKIAYILELEKQQNISFWIKKTTKPAVLDEIIVKNWEYNISKNIIRKLFIWNPKYTRWKEADNVMKILINEWQKLNLWSLEWPFSQWDFDNFVQRINQLADSWEIKDDKVKMAAIKFRRLKEINTLRNDFLETLIFESNENIIPTLNHRRWVDFFINWVSFDQKVSRSVTNQFKKDFWEDWKNFAINNPIKVAEYLYKYQDEGRFWADERLLIVYLDENVSADKIKQIIDSTNLEIPLELNFSYIHSKWKPNQIVKNYKVNCFCVLLYS